MPKEGDKMKIVMTCPNCSEKIETSNTIEVRCPKCSYIIKMSEFIKESANNSKRVTLNESNPK